MKFKMYMPAIEFPKTMLTTPFKELNCFIKIQII